MFVFTQESEFAQMSMSQIQHLCDIDLSNRKAIYQHYMDFAKVTHFTALHVMPFWTYTHLYAVLVVVSLVYVLRSLSSWFIVFVRFSNI